MVSACHMRWESENLDGPGWSLHCSVVSAMSWTSSGQCPPQSSASPLLSPLGRRGTFGHLDFPEILFSCQSMSEQVGPKVCLLHSLASHTLCAFEETWEEAVHELSVSSSHAWVHTSGKVDGGLNLLEPYTSSLVISRQLSQSGDTFPVGMW
jgi:hypothetical protein